MVTPDQGAPLGTLGLQRFKTMKEMQYLENNMGGKLVDNYVMGPYAASAVFYEVRKCFN